MDPPHKTLTLTVPNGILKKHSYQQQIVYRECLKNHAASLGGHSLDGCCEFMPSPSSNPSDPTSLTCAACGCHRNFHRRLPHHHRHLPEHDDSEDNDDDVGNNYNGETSSAPHMLMALSAAVGTTPEKKAGVPAGSSRKRFRTRFSAEQKEGMLQLSERLGWRMQKRDEAIVDDRCRELGVGRSVFKVWMHNNKHNFVPSPRAAAGDPAVAPPPPNVSSLAIPTVTKGGGGDGRVNGSGSSAMDTN